MRICNVALAFRIALGLALGLTVYLVGTPQSFAEAPPTVNIRGQLFDLNGAAITGLRSYSVRFFNAEINGTQLGANLSGTVTVSDEGIFNISVTLPVAVLSSAQAWYEISVDSNATPNGLDANDRFPQRVKIESVPFALYAGEAGHVDAEDVGAGNIDDVEFNALDGVTNPIQSQLNGKPNSADVYTTTELDASQAEQTAAIVLNATGIVQNAADLALKSSFAWVVANASVAAAPNHGYIADSPLVLTVILPSNASLTMGDTVRVSGLGEGGWVIAPNAGQEILLTSLGISTNTGSWSELTALGSRKWYGVAASADATKLVACDFGGVLYTSTDSGANWTPRMTDANRFWWSVASSADGTKLIASDQSPGYLYTSTDSGVTWIPRMTDATRGWYGVASSADGTKLVACHNDGFLYTSTDSGANWTPQLIDSTRGWYDVASSADGTKLVANVLFGFLYTSTDSGANWTSRLNDSNRIWRTVASSAGGTKLVAGNSSNNLHTSIDSGATWTARESAGNRSWWSIASSDNGINLVAADFGGYLYTSADSGASWIPQTEADSRKWQSVATSSDGTKIIAGVSDGFMYTFNMGVEEAVSSGVTGGAEAALELQYIGNGTFRVLSFVGSLGTN
jgi:hypothetical protein